VGNSRVGKSPGQFGTDEFEPFSLPYSEVRVLDLRVRQIRRTPGPEKLIKRREFPEENRERPTIENDVMHRQYKNVLAGGKPQQLHAQQRQAFRVKRQSRFPRQEPPDFLLAVVQRLGLQINDRHFQRQGWRNDLNRLPTLQVESSPQNFMAADDLMDGLLQCPRIEGAFQTHRDGDVVQRAVWLKLFEKPESLLPRGNWKCKHVSRGKRHHFVASRWRGLGDRHRHLISQRCFDISPSASKESGFTRYCSRETRVRPGPRRGAGRAVRRSISLANSATVGFSNKLRMDK